jgi:hypothetical protein
MVLAEAVDHLSVEGYSEVELQNEARYEQVPGRLDAMVGVSGRHDSIAISLRSALHSSVVAGSLPVAGCCWSCHPVFCLTARLQSLVLWPRGIEHRPEGPGR